MEGARSILLSITGGDNLSLWEVNEAAKSVSEAAHPDANIIFGAMVDEKLDDQVWVTVVATGYGDEGRRKSVGRLKEPAGESEVQRAGRRAKPRGADLRQPGRGGLAVDELEVPEFIPQHADCVLARLDATSTSASASASHAGGCGIALRMSAGEKGVVAAGHPLTAEAGARVLREGGNAVDAAVAAMLMSFVAESLLTGLGAGGYMLVAGGGRRPRCSTSSCRRPPTRVGANGSEAELQAIDVSFGDAAQVFHIGPASCGVYGAPAGVCEAMRALGDGSARGARGAGRAGSRARASC